MRYVNLDSSSGHFNSSSATLSLPANARVVRAYLYWGADLARGVDNGPEAGAPGGETPSANPLWRRALLRVGGAAYVSVDATDPARDGEWAGVASWYSQPGNRPGFAYQVRADVTDELRAGVQASKRRGRAGTQLTDVTVANVQAGRGYNRHAGWTLFVAWESPSAAWRNLTLFDGFDFVQVQGGQQLVVGPLNFTGFRTPASGAVDAHVTTWAYEGDRSITGDYLALGQLGRGCANLPKRSNAANPEDNFFNGSISRGGVGVGSRNPAYTNQLGFDLDTLTIPEGDIPHDATGAAACLGTVGDTYFFGGLAFDVLIRAPNVHIAKVADRSQASAGDLVTYTTSVTNPQRGPDDPLYPTPTVAATNMVVTDPVPSGLDFVGFVSNPGGTCAYVAASRLIRCAVGTLEVDGSFVYQYQARVNAAAQGASATSLVNTACYHANSEDAPDTDYFGCDQASVVVPANSHTDLGVVKTVSTQTVAPGATLTWRIVATNHGPGVSTGFVLADQLPAGIAFVSATASAALTCTTPAVGAGGVVTCTAPSIPAAPAQGSTVTLTITGTVSPSATDGALVLNIATVNGDQNEPVPDPNPNRDSAATRVIVSPPEPVPPLPTPPDPDPDGPPQPPVPPAPPPFVPPGLAGTRIVLHKQATPRKALLGGPLVYHLRVVNTGEAGARRIRVCDLLPPSLVAVSGSGFRRRGSLACTTISQLRPRGQTTVVLRARVSPTAKVAFVVNRAIARALNSRATRSHAIVSVRPPRLGKCPSRTKLQSLSQPFC
jgi:uncharacterized repeat protein (TIGR01451 family)